MKKYIGWCYQDLPEHQKESLFECAVSSGYESTIDFILDNKLVESIEVRGKTYFYLPEHLFGKESTWSEVWSDNLENCVYIEDLEVLGVPCN